MDKIKIAAQRLGIITVEDMERYTALELIMLIANKMNDYSDELHDLSDRVQYLLNEGLLAEVIKIFDEWLQDGTFDTLINQSAFKEVNDRIDETNAQLSATQKQRINVEILGLIPSNSVDNTQKLQNIINNYERLWFPKGRYVISQPIMLKSNLDILCEDGAEFFLKDMSRCIMFDTDSTKTYENITINGGTFNGNDYGQGPQSGDGFFNFSNAFRFYRVNNLKITNILLRDVRGHAIQHWGCDRVIFENIEINQNVDLVNRPNGGSRRDGITGASSNVVYRNIRGFTDDDMIAIISGVDWGELQVEDVNNIIIDNVVIQDKKLTQGNKQHTWGAVRIGCANGHTTRNVTVSNIRGYAEEWLIRLGGYDNYRDGFLENIVIENVSLDGENYKDSYDEHGVFLLEQCECKDLTMKNISARTKNPYRGAFFCNHNAKIEKLTLENIEFYHQNTGTNKDETMLVKDRWSDDSFNNVFIDNLFFSNISYDSNNPMKLYAKRRINHTTLIPNITHIEGSGLTSNKTTDMIEDSQNTFSLNSTSVSILDENLKHQKAGYCYRAKNRLVLSSTDSIVNYTNREYHHAEEYTSFNPKQSVVFVEATTETFRIQEDTNYEFPVGFMITIKRIDNNAGAEKPYIKMSNESGFWGIHEEPTNIIQLKPKQQVTLLHTGECKWAIVSSSIDEF